VNFEQKLKDRSSKEIWQEYCGFLDLSIDEFIDIQCRLLQEQIDLLSKCGLGQRFFKGKVPQNVDEFRKMVPLTTYEDYADILLPKRADMLPADPVVWLQTTWESGCKPEKWAPYSEAMLDVYKNNIIAAMILSTSDERGHFHVRPGFRALYALAPMPYATGLFPDLIDSELKVKFLPPLKEARSMSFGQQSKVGFKMGMQSGMEMFFGMSGIIHRITQNFGDIVSGGGGADLKAIMNLSPKMLSRLARAKYISSRDNRPIMPKDIFHLDGFVCVGTDTELYKSDLERAWGRRPLEVMGGTEPACIATETWSKDGLSFFPDTCFYEFIPESEMLRNLNDPSYQPRTCLMNELTANQNYELVITVLKGGAFVRYRPGDVYRCVRLKHPVDGLDCPQFQYMDRIPTVIDIAGFTRITENSINNVIELSGLDIGNWFALKKYDDDKRSYMQMYVEMGETASRSAAACSSILSEHLSIYFKLYDEDYGDLKHMLGIEPLSVQVLPRGTMDAYQRRYREPVRKINASRSEEIAVLQMAAECREAVAE
jgi:hypothetical protein